MTPTFTHLGLCVRDLPRSRRFYEALGFAYDGSLHVTADEAADRMIVARPVDLDVVYLTLGPFVLELLAFATPPTHDMRFKPLNEPGLTHFTLTVEALAPVEAAALAHGGSVLEATRGPEKVWIADPDGQRIELLTTRAGFHSRPRATQAASDQQVAE